MAIWRRESEIGTLRCWRQRDGASPGSTALCCLRRVPSQQIRWRDGFNLFSGCYWPVRCDPLTWPVIERQRGHHRVHHDVLVISPPPGRGIFRFWTRTNTANERIPRNRQKKVETIADAMRILVWRKMGLVVTDRVVRHTEAGRLSRAHGGSAKGWCHECSNQEVVTQQRNREASGRRGVVQGRRRR